MKTIFSRRIVFISKSLLWSVMLYVVCMLAINWDEITKGNMPKTMEVTQAPALIPAEPLADARPAVIVSDTAITGLSSVLHTAGNVITGLVKAAGILKK